MDWTRAIEINRVVLLRIVAELVAVLAALEEMLRLPKPVHCSLGFGLFKEEEAAVQRLIVIGGVSVTLHSSIPFVKERTSPRWPAWSRAEGNGSGSDVTMMRVQNDPGEAGATCEPRESWRGAKCINIRIRELERLMNGQSKVLLHTIFARAHQGQF